MFRRLLVYAALLAAAYYGYQKLMAYAAATPDIRVQATSAVESERDTNDSNPVAKAVRHRDEAEKSAQNAEGAPAPAESAAP